MEIELIVAKAKNNVIGDDLKLPWPRLSTDMQWFVRNTIGKAVVMGRKTFESLNGRMLKDRVMIVLSKSLKQEEITNKDPNLYVCHSIEAVFDLTKKLNKKLIVIGGSEVYRQFIEIGVSKIFLTEVDKECDGNVFCPDLELENFNRTLNDIVSEKGIMLTFFTFEKEGLE